MSNSNKAGVTNKEQFVLRSRFIHGMRYSYENSVYTKSKDKIIITCKIHGDFSISAGDHISSKGYGCRKCAMVRISRQRSLSRDDVLKQFIKKHGSKYCYDNFKYLNNKEKSEIICKEHGAFLMSASDHKQGNGCSKCSKVYIRSYGDVVLESNKKHNYKYQYVDNNYKNSESYLLIVCPIHGEFKQRAISHLRGRGCRECGKEELYGYKKSGYVDLARKNHSGFSNFYIVEMSHGNELFYKQGITMKNISERFRKTKIIYNVKKINVYRGDASLIWDLEIKLKKLNMINSYKPMHSFSGETECFSKIPSNLYDEINRYIMNNELILVG